MTTLNKKATNRLKRLDRKVGNTVRKGMKAIARTLALVELGKTLVPGKRTVITGYEEVEVPRQRRKVVTPITEVKEVLIAPPTGPKTTRGRVKEPRQFRSGYSNSTRLVWLGGKAFHQHGALGKTRPGNKELHTEANVENGIGDLARKEAKAREPKPTPDIPIIPLDSLPEIGQPEVQQ